MIHIKRTYLVNALTKACSVASDDDHRYYANGIWFDASNPGTLTLVASDALQLYLASVPCHNEKPGAQILITRKNLAAMLKVIKTGSEYAEIEMGEEGIKIDDYSYPFIAGNYPPYEMAMPDRPYMFGGIISCKPWVNALKILSTVTDKNNLFTLQGDCGSAFIPGICEATVDLPWVSSVPEVFRNSSIHYNISLLRNILSQCGESAEVNWENINRPVQIEPTTKVFRELFLLVPARF